MSLRSTNRSTRSDLRALLLALGCAVLGLAACSDERGDTPAPTATSAPAAAAPAEARETADLVLRGGLIETVDAKLGRVAAVAVRGATILAAGSDEQIEPYIGADTEVIELDGRLVTPGFIEGHGHFMSLGRAKQILDLSTAESWSDIVTQVARAADSAAEGEWILGRGWHQEKWSAVPEGAVEGVPTHDTLSAISEANPVLLGHASGHAAFVNRAALAAAGIDASTVDPFGGTIVRDAAGNPTGLLREKAEDLVAAVVAEVEARRDPEEIERVNRDRVRLAGQEALRHGVTSFHDAGASFETIEFLGNLEDEGALPIRLYVMVRGESNDDMAAKLAEVKRVADGDDYLTVRSIKRQIDGALGAHGAWLLDPYEDLPASIGLVLEPVAEIERTAEIAIANGYQVNTHAIGTRANRETLDLYERAWQAAEVSGKDLRWRIEHAQHVHPDDVPRFGSLGVIAAMQGIHCTSDGPWIAARLGEERTGITSYPWRDLIRTGATLGNGTDVPVEPIDALASFHASVTRIMKNGEVFYPRNVLTREEALASYTINNAYAAFEEHLKGSITPGKLADLVVLSADIMTIPVEEILTTQIDYTILGGKVRYARAP